MKIKKILVSQPKPSTPKSPYFDLSEKNNVKIDFRPFIQVEGVSSKEFRQQKINILDHTAVVFTSRTAIDHFFRICEETRVTVPDDMKYFCISEATAFYLQKYIVYRKRKIFHSTGKFPDLVEVIKKHKQEKFLVPLSDIHKPEIPNLLTKAKIKYTKAILYRTVSSDLSDLKDINYDVLVFFSPSGIKSLMQNFPDFEQKDTLIASFGPATAKAVKEAGLRLDIQAPMPQAPSMTAALEMYIKKHNKK
ncbi:uroporphyrinogen-III synthase [Marinilabilia salmonicolor]|uniref:Uroporphyrinogen-III synthase n=1 Tax=Marinilabilia salmonicolor TaxID=989 RepID=A0A2T0XSC5_9BACT|nr:uroporphyrinogen-III synthase [Marinilabilia salmonicolor]PRZ01838.1 uroporphyrinogen-III synthase [Marinilabilia salmonicolor]RCW29831.1 uroporphyrinogen-III synthase [Marinilabilia salmonicolor]